MSYSSSYQRRSNAPLDAGRSRLRRFLIESLEHRVLLAADVDWSKSLSLETLQSGKGDLSSSQVYSYDNSGITQKMVVLSDRLALDLSAQAESNPALLSSLGLTLSRPLDQAFSVYTTNEPVTNSLLQSLQSAGVVEKSVPVFGMVGTKSEAVLLNEVIVSLPTGVTASNYFSDSRFSGYRRLDGTPDQFVGTIRDTYGVDALEVINDIAKSNQVTWVTPNFYQAWQKYYVPNDPRFANQWHLDNFGQGGGQVDIDSNLPEAWDVMQGGSSTIVVGVVDDGVPTNHPDISVWTNLGEIVGDGVDNDGNGWIDDINGWNFVTNNNVSIPDTSSDMHGTSVSGVAAAAGDNGQGVAGAAYKSLVLSARIFRGGGVASDANIASAVYYAAGRNASGVGTFAAGSINNHSWGGGAPSAAITAAFQWASTQGRGGLGAPQLIAAGNDFGSVSYPGSLSATLPGVICVGAINNFGSKSDYSNFGPEIDIVTGSNDTRAGYLAIDTTDRIGTDGYASGDYTGTGATGFGGTSSATPLAAGIGALTLARAEQLGVNITAADLKKMYRNNTKLVGPNSFPFPTGRNNNLGWGLLNAETLVSGIGGSKISIVTETESINPNSLKDIGQSYIGATYTLRFRIRNQGTAVLNLGTLSVSGTDFSVSESPASSTLQVGESTFFSITLKPTVAGAKLGTVDVQSNDNGLPSMQFFITSISAPPNVSGYVYEDYNGDFQFSSDEPGLPNQTVLLDANNNSVYDYSNFTNNTPLPIVDLTTVTSSQNITGFSGGVKDLNVTINATHTWVSDLTISLVSPSGARAKLIEARGGAGLNLTNTVFDDDATTSIASGAAPFTGSFIPETPLSVFENSSPNGTWTLEVYDSFSGDQGTVLNWKISVTSDEIATTDSSGYYFFGGLANGNYNVVGQTAVNYSAVGTTQYPIAITSPSSSFTDRNFGVAQNFTAYAHTFNDLDRNGIHTINEPGLANQDFTVTPSGTINTNVSFTTPSAILDLQTIDLPLVVPTGIGNVQDVNVSLNLTHTWDSDLSISLIGPLGQTVDLTSGNGGSGDNYTNTVFDDSAANPIITGAAPFTGTFRPEQSLSIFNGLTASGTWTLRIADLASGDSGTLISWGLSIVSSLNTFTTNADGWAKIGLSPGGSAISLAATPGWYFTNPLSGTRNVFTAGQPVLNQVFGTRVIDPPIMDSISDITISEDAPTQVVGLTGIVGGGGPNQILSITATSSNPTLIPNPGVSYVSGNLTGSLSFTPAANRSGQSIISVTLTDSSTDGIFGTSDDLSVTNSFTVTVLAVNDPPTISSLPNVTIDEDSAPYLVNFSGITSGPLENQPLKLTVTSSNTALIPNPLLNYFSPNPSGSFSFQPLPNQFGTSIMSITVTDGGLDNNLLTPLDNATITTSFTVTVNPISDPPAFDPIADITFDEDSTNQVITVTGINTGANEIQPLRLIAKSSLPGQIVNLTTNYVSPNSTGTIVLDGLQDQYGSLFVTVLVEDGGLDSDLSTPVDNAVVQRTFNVTVRPLNDPPIVTVPSDFVINEDAPPQTINLTGIAGGPNEPEPVLVSFVGGDPALLLNQSLSYTSPSTTGQITFTPAPNKFGSTVMMLRLEDAGPDFRFNTTADNLVSFQPITVTVLPVNDPPSFDAIGSMVINEDNPGTIVNLTGVTAGLDEIQPMRFTASSSNTFVVPDPTITYTSPNSAGSILIVPVANQSGTAVITVTLEDGGVDANLATLADNTSVVKTFTVTVAPVNDLPTINSISNLTVLEDAATQTVLLTGIAAGANESQPLRVSATSSNVTLLANPTINYGSPNSTGLLIFTPNSNQFGSSVITVTVEDGGLDQNLLTSADNGFATQTFTISVTGVNDAPTLADLSNLLLNEDSAAQNIALSGISAGPGESQALRVSAFSNSLLISASVIHSSPGSTGTLVLTPIADGFGTATINVSVEDGGLDNDLLTPNDNGLLLKSFTVTVAPVNDVPTLNPIANVSANEGGRATADLQGISAGGGESQSLRISATSSNSGLVSTLNVNYLSPEVFGAIEVIPTTSAFGSAVITVTVEDSGLDGNFGTAFDNKTFTQSFTFTVNPVNDAPTINDILDQVINEDEPRSITVTGISAGGGENQPLRITVLSDDPNLANASVVYTSGQSAATINLVPEPNQFGSTSFLVVVEDGGLDNDLSTLFDNGLNAKTFALSVLPINDNPSINPLGNESFDEDGQIQIDLTGINAGPGETQSLRVTAFSSTPSVIGTPAITYVSPSTTGSLQLQSMADMFGKSVITVVVEDAGSDNNLNTLFDNLTSTFSFTVTVNPVNDQPVVDDLAHQSVDEDLPSSVTLTGIGAGPNESQLLRVTAFVDNTDLLLPPIVTLDSLNSSAELTLTPLADVSGSVVVTYVVEDGGLDNDLETSSDNASITKSFTVDILPVNDPPVIDLVSDQLIEWNSVGRLVSLAGIAGGPGESGPIRIVVNSDDPSILPNPVVNYVSPQSSAELSLTPTSGAFGVVVVEVVVEDGGEDGDVNTVGDNLSTSTSFEVTINAIPVANSERVRTSRGVTTTFDVLLNDTDEDGGVSGLTAVITAQPPASAGTVEVLPSGSIRFVPAAGFFGISSFSYFAMDQHGSVSVETEVVLGVGRSALQNPFMHIDVNRSGTLSASDALDVIDVLNSATLSKLVDELIPYRFDVDVNGDGRITPVDAIIVIDALNAIPRSAGESTIDQLESTEILSSVDAFFADLGDVDVVVGKRSRRNI